MIQIKKLVCEEYLPSISDVLRVQPPWIEQDRSLVQNEYVTAVGREADKETSICSQWEKVCSNSTRLVIGTNRD